MNHKNPYGQPIGYPVEDWQESAFPPRSTMIGKWCRVESLVPEKHAEELFAAYVKKRNDQDWTYLPYGPFESFDDYQSWLTKTVLVMILFFTRSQRQKQTKLLGWQVF